MKKIVFIWCNSIIEGIIMSQEPCAEFGQRTLVQTNDGPKITIYGLCKENTICGPVAIISITDQLCLPPSPLAALTMQGYASGSELKAAGYKKRFDMGRNEWGFNEYVIVDNNNNQWDYIPEDMIYELRERPQQWILNQL